MMVAQGYSRSYALPIALPTLLESPPAAEGTPTVNTITTGTLVAKGGATLVTMYGSRTSASRTFNAPTTSGLVMATGWTNVRSFTVLDTDASAWVHGSMWWARVADDSTGTVTQTTNASVQQRVLAVAQIVGANLVAPLGLNNVATHETGTSLAVDLGSVPAASSVGLTFGAFRVNDAGITDPAGFSQLLDTNISAGVQCVIHAILGSATQTATYSALATGEARGLIYAEFLD